MKKINLLLFIFPFLLIIGCKSNEEKADELIKTELSKKLYDYDSYQPIETIVTEAKMTRFNDSTCWEQGRLLDFSMQKAQEYFKEYKMSVSSMDLWIPSSFSTSYSNSQYYKYKNESIENLLNVEKAYRFSSKIASELSDRITTLDSTKVIGWNVIHRFRCKTRGGQADIANYRYVIDEDFSHILIREDMDADKGIRASLESIDKEDYETLVKQIESLIQTIKSYN